MIDVGGYYSSDIIKGLCFLCTLGLKIAVLLVGSVRNMGVN